MRVLHVPFGYFPEAVGGTEVYVADLCEALSLLAGVESLVAAPSAAAGVSSYQGVPVMRYAVSRSLNADQMYGEGDAAAASELVKIVYEKKPQLVHFHAYSPGVPVAAARGIKALGLPMVYTYHTPTATCARGTLLRNGIGHCDGEMKPLRCAGCMLQGLGVPTALAYTAAAASALLAPFTNGAGVKWRSYPLQHQRIDSVRKWLGLMDRVIALGAWGRELLLRNGVPAEKLRVVRHGVPVPKAPIQRTVTDRDSLRLLFLGRADPTKGLDVLLAALRLIPDAKLELRLHTIAQAGGDAYQRRIQQMCEADSRVQLLPPVKREEVYTVLSQADALLVPSLWYETGPLVMLEAFQSGVPVIGSGWGGIAEWVEHGVNGLLVHELTAEAWARQLSQLVDEPALLDKLRSGVRPPRSTTAVASEVLSVYQELLPLPLV
jgi:glycosyltransferase involved in cell wall biosynthesis